MTPAGIRIEKPVVSDTPKEAKAKGPLNFFDYLLLVLTAILIGVSAAFVCLGWLL